MLKPDVNPYFSNFAIPFIGYLSKAIYNIPKKTSDWSLITHLYYPPGYCVTDFLDETLATVQYSKCNNIIYIIQTSQDLPFLSAVIGTPNLLQIVLNLNILFEHSISDISARKKA
jgi:hypothetical protein